MTKPVPSRRQYETLREAAQRVGVSERTLRRRIATRDLRVYRLGNRIIPVVPDDVDALLRSFPSAG